ncbi:MAG: dockerin type I repeat-containing protein [Clostridia bacterium]|nr:dockerin type I repeat-containing protein [Clostridia bacterium]
MKNIKKCLSLVLSFAIVMLTALPVFSTEKEYRKGDIIEFGSYPQEKVVDSVLIERLEDEIKNWQEIPYQKKIYNCSFPIYSTVPSKVEYHFCDIILDKEKYRAVKTLEDGSVNYFRFTPIEWLILNPETGYVISASILDKKAFYNQIEYNDSAEPYGFRAGENLDKDALDYTTSDLRVWLNNEFYNTAFSTIQKKSVKLTKIENRRCGNRFSELDESAVVLFESDYGDITYEYKGYASSEDNVFLISGRDFYEYGFHDVTEVFYNNMPEPKYEGIAYASVSEYAEQIGVRVAEERWSFSSSWWLRSAGGNDISICRFIPWLLYMREWYGLDDSFDAASGLGIRPAMCIDLENFDKTYIIGDVDGDGGISSSDARIALRAAVGLEEVTPDMIATVDVDKDKSITASDARLILRAAVGLEKLS